MRACAHRSLSVISLVAVCASLVGVVLMRTAPTALQQEQQQIGDATFVWENPAAAGPSAASSSVRQQRSARKGRVVARGRLATQRAAANEAPLGFNIEKVFDSSYARGQGGSTSLIHIDLPIQQVPVQRVCVCE